MRFSSMILAGCLLSTAGAQWREKTEQSAESLSAARVALEQLSASERENSCIAVEFDRPDSGAALLGREVERLWNVGRFGEALAQLGHLEARVGHVAVGNSWRKPVPTTQTGLWGRDVRIGDRDSLAQLCLETQVSSGNLFAVLRRDSGLPHWSVCMSTDSGATWTETYTWSGSRPTSLDAAVATRHLYVVYNSPAENPQQVRLRSLLCSNGRADGTWAAPCTLDAGDTMREVSLVSNQNNNQLGIVALVSDGSVLVSFGDANATSWTKLPTGIDSGACSGLDATDDGRSDTTSIFFSYHDTSDSLRLYSSSGQRLTLHAGRGSSTSISAFCSTIVCAYEDEAASPHRVRYATSIDGGDSWMVSTLSDSGVAADAPAVTVSGGLGFAALYRSLTSAPELMFRRRTDSGVWSDPVSITENAPFNSRPGIVSLGMDVCGAAYLSDTSPVVRGAWFDRSDWSYGIAERRRLVAEQGLLCITPNPLKGQGRVSCALSRPADLRLQVYDRAGCFVRTVYKGRALAGRKAVALDAADLSPGVYFIRAATESSSWTVPVAIVR